MINRINFHFQDAFGVKMKWNEIRGKREQDN